MTQMCHDNLATALRLVVSTCSCQLAAEPRNPARAREKHTAERQRPGDIPVLRLEPQLEPVAVDVAVTHASAKSYAAQTATQAGCAAARAEWSKRTRFRKDVLHHAALRFAPFAVETCGYMGKEAARSVHRLGDIAAEWAHSQGLCVCALGNAAAVGDGAAGEC